MRRLTPRASTVTGTDSFGPTGREWLSRAPDRLLRFALAITAFVILGSVALLQVAHVDDKYQVTDNGGVWMTLATEAADGKVYRPLYDGQFYGGTRYMPLPILSYAAAAKLSGDPLVSGKVLAYGFALTLFVLLFLVLRSEGCSELAALALIAGIAVTSTGLLAETSLHFDTPATAFQLGALWLVSRSERAVPVGAAGALCALALLSKLNAVWAVIAIALWLAFRNRRRLLVLLPVYLGTLGLLGGSVELASDGRFSANLRTLGFAGYHGSLGEKSSALSFGDSVVHLYDYSSDHAAVVLALVPFALASLVVTAAGARRRLTLFQVAFLVLLPLLVFLYRDQGADYNHLIDPAVMTVVLVGGLWGRSRSRTGEFTWLRGAVAAVLVVGAVLEYHAPMYDDAKGAVKKLAGRGGTAYDRRPLAGYVARGDTILSEDPYIPVSLGQRPVVLDSFMYLRLAKSHPDWVRALAARVQRVEFDRIVLLSPIADSPEFGHFGGPANKAILLNYRLKAVVPPYGIFVRKRAARS